MKKNIIGFDFDNTLFDAIESDYEIYRRTSLSIGKDPIAKYIYTHYRRNGKLLKLLEILKLDADCYYKSRKNFESNEHYYFLDKPIVDVNLFNKLITLMEVHIISKRSSKAILLEQLEKNSIKINHNNVHITHSKNSNLFTEKYIYLKRNKISLYIGDANKDFEDSLIAGIEFIQVKTGFDVNYKSENLFSDVNGFLLNFISHESCKVDK